ncbi:MAG: GDYXXLXY domain-containing protein [Elusimicrobiota bacterium]
MNKLKLTLLIQILFFAVFGGWLYINREKYIMEFYLKTIPVDPRDYLSGTYVDLRFKSEETALKCLTGKTQKGVYHYQAYLKFEPTQEKFKDKNGKEYFFHEVADCSLTPIYEKNWIKAQIYTYDNKTSVTITRGDRFYMNENDPRKNIPSDKTAVKVRILRDKTLGIIDLIETQ